MPLRRWPWFAAILVLLAVGATAAAVRADREDDRDAVKGWDHRVVSFVRFVEEHRGLRFRHAVPTEFLSDADFREEITRDSDLTQEDIDELHHYEGLFRALGLVEGQLDLRAATKTLAGEEVIGVFDPDEDRILIRGDRITAGMRPTIVHELTHALQDQHFDLDREHDDSGEDAAFTALVEADALRIEDQYVASLSPEEQEEIDASDAAQAEDIDLTGVPKILTELFSLPYVLGPPFIDALVEDGGDTAVNRAFEHPPTTEEDIVDPGGYLDGAERVKVTPPKLRAGERRVGKPDDFGMISLLLVLGERLPFDQAWTAVEGWAGDSSVSFRDKGKDCIRIRERLDTPADADELTTAARAWAEGRPSATVTRSGRVVEISSCDPGTDTSANTPDRPRTFELLQLRVELIAELERGGATRQQAGCVADAVFREHDPAALLDVVRITDPRDPRLVRLQRDVQAAAERCR